MKLNSAIIAGLKEPPAGKSDAIYFCSVLPGFGLRLRARAAGAPGSRNIGSTGGSGA